MRWFHPTLLAASLTLAFACTTTKPAPGPDSPEPDVAPETLEEAAAEPQALSESQSTTSLAKPADAAVNARVSDAEERLAKSEAGRLVWASITAHGGLERWFSNGPIQFRFAYTPVGKPARDTYQVVDTWSSRAVHEIRPENGVSFGWDGTNAWIAPAETEPPTNVRFWSLTPYYFVGVPFVLADRGVNLAMEGEAQFEGKTYDVVRVTFGEGVGDAPEDFYVVYFDRETKRVAGLRYIVTYKGFFPDGGHSPEKLMSYDGAQTVDGITLPETFRTFKWDGTKHGEKVTDTTLTEVSFAPETPDSRFEMPEGARALEGY